MHRIGHSSPRRVTWSAGTPVITLYLSFLLQLRVVIATLFKISRKRSSRSSFRYSSESRFASANIISIPLPSSSPVFTGVNCVMSSHSAFDGVPPQVIEGQYLDQRKLISLLRNVYGTSNEGKNNFRVEVIQYIGRHEMSLTLDSYVWIDTKYTPQSKAMLWLSPRYFSINYSIHGSYH